MKQKYLTEDFIFFRDKINAGENFTLMRLGDGECMLMSGRSVSAQEGWSSPPELTSLGKALLDSLLLDDPKVWYGISCPCCDRESYYWYRSHIPSENFTFANIFVNKNYPPFKEFFPTIKRKTILIANYRARGKKIGNLDIIKHYEIPDGCVEFWENGAEELIEQIKKDYGKEKNLLYAVSAGPLSEPVIAALFKNNPDNCYIDFGSSLDGFYREVVTRPYMIPGTVYAERNCVLHNDPAFNVDVSIVLTLYKRPEMLEKQLNALEKQSLKPKEILLIQDGTADGSIVEIPEHLKNRFHKISVREKNCGVWERFRFAREMASCPYVCVFDDDAVPGRRFLENCHTEMMKRPALYGALGIVARDRKSYPLGKYYRVGWPEDAHLHKTAEVDFAGHAWFFKREYLEELFKAPVEVSSLKRAAEDMSFSYQLQKIGIPTLIPPNPEGRSEFYGSLPEYGKEAGNNMVAISKNTENLKIMNEAFCFLTANGWELMCERRKFHVILLWIYLRIVGNCHILSLYRKALKMREQYRQLKKRVKKVLGK